MKLLLRWAASALAVAAAIRLLPGLTYDGRLETLFVVALILGLVNAFVRPVVKLLSCGLIVLTLGLFLFVVNALMLYLTAYLSQYAGFDFRVDGFADAVLGSIIISLVTWFLSLLIRDDGDRR